VIRTTPDLRAGDGAPYVAVVPNVTTSDPSVGPLAELPLAEVHEAIAATRPDEDCLVFRDRRLSWAEVTERTRRLANHLIAQGLGVHTERHELPGHLSGQDHLAIYLHNGNEYLESMLGALKARVASLNVNYRYVAEELQYLLAGAISLAFVGMTILYPEFAGIEGITGYLFVVVLVGYVFVLASDRLRQSPYYPFIQAIFLLAWGGYNVSRARFGLLTIILLIGGTAALLWEGYQLSQEGAMSA